jgi:hypothetical protein
MGHAMKLEDGARQPASCDLPNPISQLQSRSLQPPRVHQNVNRSYSLRTTPVTPATKSVPRIHPIMI